METTNRKEIMYEDAVKTADRAAASRAVENAYWLIITSAYLLISFLTGRWGVTWLIFVIAAALKAVVRAVMAVRDLRSAEAAGPRR